MPSDLLLLLIRLAIVALAVGAIAGPIVVTSGRVHAWNARTARAVIVDASASMRSGDGVTREAAAREAARAEISTATYGRSFDARTFEEGIDRAAAWLTATPPARREVVVLSDFQRGAMTRAALARLPASIGIRLVTVGRPVAKSAIAGADLLSAPGVPARRQSIELTADSTMVKVETRTEDQTRGVRWLGGVTAAEQHALSRALAIAGTPAGSDREPIAVLCDGAAASTVVEGVTAIHDAWMLQTVLRLRNDPSVSAAMADGTMRGVAVQAPWTSIVNDREGKSIVRAAANGNELVIAMAAPASSFAAATVVRAALTARRPPDVYAEQEIGGTDEQTLAALSRPSAPVDRGGWRNADVTDARWLWLAALVLLGVEQWLRGGADARTREEVSRAAA
jgi:hypothetical protein